MMGLFSPFRHDITEWRGYDISKLKDNFRELNVVLNRDGSSPTTCLYFNGACNYFEELPPPEELQGRYEEYLSNM